MNTESIPSAISALPILRENMQFLSDHNRRFASDLLDHHARKGTLTERQAPWVGKLLDRVETAQAPTDPTKAESIGDVSGIKALFDRAAVHLKAPAVVMSVPDVGVVRVYVGKQYTRFAGKTVVADYDKPWPQGNTYGIINAAGQFEPKKDVTIPATLIPTLKDFALDPIKHAKAYGKLTGRCCFCRNPLEDARSTSQGYGPICAKRFKFPWGERPEDDTLFLASDTATDQGAPDLTNFETPTDDEHFPEIR